MFVAVSIPPRSLLTVFKSLDRGAFGSLLPPSPSPHCSVWNMPSHAGSAWCHPKAAKVQSNVNAELFLLRCTVPPAEQMCPVLNPWLWLPCLVDHLYFHKGTMTLDGVL